MSICPSRVAVLLAFAATAPAADNLTGTWLLNVGNSSWDGMQAPASLVLKVEHNEPRLKYHGHIVYASGAERDFHFDGALDGNEYPMTRSYGSGMVTLKRFELHTFKSEFHSTDGRYVERAEVRLSVNSRRLTRKVRLETPEGVKYWTEIYEKQ